MAAIALKNIEIMKREKIVEGVLENEAMYRSKLEQLLELPIAGDLRGAGCFYALELVKNKETRESSPTRSPSGSCEASSPRSCSSAA